MRGFGETREHRRENGGGDKPPCNRCGEQDQRRNVQREKRCIGGSPDLPDQTCGEQSEGDDLCEVKDPPGGSLSMGAVKAETRVVESRGVERRRGLFQTVARTSPAQPHGEFTRV